MKSLEKMASMNANNIEEKQMKEIFGGAQSGSPCTAKTYTHNSDNTGQCDGDDSYEGECGVAVGGGMNWFS